MSKNLSQAAAVGIIGLGSYAYYNTVDKFEKETASKVIEYQNSHLHNQQLEQLLEIQVPQRLVNQCREELQQCLKAMPLSEICQNSLTVTPQAFYNLYGSKGLNEHFSYPATVCYSQIAESVDQCETTEIDCLRSDITADLRAVYRRK